MAKNPVADSLIGFLNASPTPFHAVESMSALLLGTGASPLDEKEIWALKPGQTVFVKRNGSSLIALRLPLKLSQGSRFSFRLAAAHTDSPCLKLKPRPSVASDNYRQWGIEVYGGALFNSWLDRDLAVSGRICRVGGEAGSERLVRLEGRPFRIPQLAIHLDRTVNETGLILNPQKHLVPVLGLADTPVRGFEGWLEEVGGAPLSSLAFDLYLHDATPAGYGGWNDEFLFSGRLDNLAMCHAALRSFLAVTPHPTAVQVIALFDNEEVGSTSAQGANSNFLVSVLERASSVLGATREEFLAALARSFSVSADMAHALHPNYPEKHDSSHLPLINRGPVIKGNAGMRYATGADTAALFRGWCEKAGVTAQYFVNRADLACGTTLGPMLAASLGVPTVDVGNPMLSMHSAREMAGSEDHGMMIRVLEEFFRE